MNEEGVRIDMQHRLFLSKLRIDICGPELYNPTPWPSASRQASYSLRENPILSESLLHDSNHSIPKCSGKAAQIIIDTLDQVLFRECSWMYCFR
jgi:hypothetical protein